MQDPSITAVTFPQLNAQLPEHEQLRCPRCDSNNTKFCYYNNYNLSQPRHFCKNCKRYWTKGGALRNIPVGGGTRKNSTKRSASKQQPRPVQNPSASLDPATTTSSGLSPGQSQNPTLKTEPVQILKNLEIGAGSSASAGSFTSLLGLASDGQFGNLTEGWNQNGPKIGLSNGSGPVQNLGLELMQRSGMSSEGFMLSGMQNGSETSCWGSSNGWSDHLAIHTPGSKFQ